VCPFSPYRNEYHHDLFMLTTLPLRHSARQVW
jgi:hypothetical protein